MQGFWTALGFLTVLPAPAGGEFDLGRAAPWFPVIGLVLAVPATGLDWLLATGGWSAAVRAVVTVTVLTVLTGTLHLDGFMDTCDGWASNRCGPDMLAVMRDSRVGAAGAAGGTLALVAAVVLLAGVAAPVARAGVLATALVTGRLAMVMSALGTGTALPGLGQELTRRLGPRRAGAAVLVAVVALLPGCYCLWSGGGRPAVVAGKCALAVAWGLAGARLAAARVERRLGGITGDVLGATCVLAELAVLFLYAGGW